MTLLLKPLQPTPDLVIDGAVGIGGDTTVKANFTVNRVCIEIARALSQRCKTQQMIRLKAFSHFGYTTPLRKTQNGGGISFAPDDHPPLEKIVTPFKEAA